MRVALVGPSRAGKTTLIREFKKLGYPVVEEYVYDVFYTYFFHRYRSFEELREDKFEYYLFQRIYTALKNLKDRQESDGIMFCDRAYYDGIIYSNMWLPEDYYYYYMDFFNTLPKVNYDKIFLIAPIVDRNPREFFLFKKVYPEATIVPPMSVEDRVEFILQKLDKGGKND